MKQCINFVLRCFDQAVKAISQNQYVKKGDVEMGSTKTAKASIAGAVKHVVDTLKAIDRGDHVCTDFMSREDVNDFCRAIGFKEDKDPEKTRLWGSLLDKEIANEGNAPSVVPEEEAGKILNLLKSEIDKGTFTPDDGSSFKTDILNDFLPKADGGLGYIWEYQFGLKVELEHGRTLGANVTNNHPLLTGIIVMAHLVESTLYYARLWVMEVEGEIFNKKIENKLDEVPALEAELARAKEYLAKREAEKLSMKSA